LEPERLDIEALTAALYNLKGEPDQPAPLWQNTLF
jgi:hypothetical protein